MIMYEDDLSLGLSDGFLFRRSYSNLVGYADGELGVSWTSTSQPRIINRDGAYMVRTEAHKQSAFLQQAGNVLTPVRSGREVLHLTASGDLVFADPAGGTMVFHGFDASIPLRQQGRLKRVYTSGGQTGVTTYDTTGFAQSHIRATLAVGQSDVIQFSYDATLGLMTAAERQLVSPGAAPIVVCRAEYSYDPACGQLRSVIVKSATGATLRRFHYRYYTTSEPGGYIGMLKYAVGPRNYARMQQLSIDPETATDTVIGQWADKSFQYDGFRRVTQQILRTPDVDGSGTFNYAYSPRSSPPANPGPNDWLMRFVETQPDGSVNTVFTNQAGDVLFKQTATSAGAVVSAEAWRFDDGWRATWHLTSAALQPVAGAWYDSTTTDLLDFASGNSPYVKDSVGLIERWTYYATTGSGAAAGYIQHAQTQQGELGTPTLVKTYTYTGSP